MNADSYHPTEKQIFVFTSAGKPIFSRLGDENDQVTTFGLLQAVASIVDDSGDSLRPSRGPRAESEAALVAQLEFLYRQIIFMLTRKIHDVLRSHPSKDLRELLGTDTFRLMHAACSDNLVPPQVAFRAIRGCPIDIELRCELLALLRACTRNSEAVAGFVFVGSQMLAFCSNDRMTQVSVGDEDILMLAHFLGNSPSLLSHEQNWVPICLSSLNPGGYVQAYIAALSSVARGAPSPSISKATAAAAAAAAADTVPYLVLISSSPDSSIFAQMHDSRQLMCEAMYVKGFYDRIQSALGHHKQALTGILDSVGAIQFFYKVNSLASSGAHVPNQGGRGQQQQLIVPSQCVWHSAVAVATGSEQELSEAGAPAKLAADVSVVCDKIWIEFQNLAVRVRVGSASLDASIREWSTSPSPALPGSGSSPSVPSAAHNLKTADSKGESAVTLALSPASDHALAYSVLEDSGFVLVALATLVSEMFVAFPGTLSPADACGQATILGRLLRQATPYLFLSMETFGTSGKADVT